MNGITSTAPIGTFDVRSNGDPGAGVYIYTPEAGPASQLIDSYDVLVHQGVADPDRVCIYGGSYACLAGLTFTPEVWACLCVWFGEGYIAHEIENPVRLREARFRLCRRL